MKISKADEGILVISLTEKIQKSRITHYSYAPVGIGWEESVYQALDPDFVKDLRSKLDGSLEAFFQERIFSIFFESGNQIPKEGEDKDFLTTYKGFEDPLKVARDLVNFLKSIPHQYTSYLPLSESLGDTIDKSLDKIIINDQLSIIKGDQLISEAAISHKINGYNRYLIRHAIYDKVKVEVLPDKWYFRFQQSGYVCRRNEPRIVADMTDAIKAFYGVLISSDVFYSFPT